MKGNAPRSIKDRNDLSIPNLTDTVSAFRQAMSDAGIHYLGEIVADGRLHRFHIEGQKAGTLNGAYVLHVDGVPAGWFMNFVTGLNQRWISQRSSVGVTYAFTQQIAEAKRQRDIELHNRHEAASAKAAHIWKCARPAVNHPYLAKKKIKPHGARQLKDSLLIPIEDESNKLVNLQFISPSGEKRFLAGGRKKECFHIIGHVNNSGCILICEGFATGASLHEETGQCVVVAFDAGNLLPVAQIMQHQHRDIEIIVAGDNDISGVGQKAANEAAAAVNGLVLIPDIPGTDWNDLIARGRHV